MADERQKKQAAKAFEKEKFSKDKEVTGAKHTENRQDNTFPTENHFHANEKPVSNLPRDANHGRFWSMGTFSNIQLSGSYGFKPGMDSPFRNS